MKHFLCFVHGDDMPYTQTYKIRKDLRRKRHKQILIDYRGGKCVKCGNSNDLAFHHRDPQSKSFTICERLEYGLGTLKAEADKCDLLCRKCHDTIRELDEKEATRRRLARALNQYYKHGKLARQLRMKRVA